VREGGHCTILGAISQNSMKKQGFWVKKMQEKMKILFHCISSGAIIRGL